MKVFLLFLLFLIILVPSAARCADFTVEGSELSDRKIVVSYDPKTYDMDEGPSIILKNDKGKSLELPDFFADWSWAEHHPEQAVYSVTWNETGEYFYITYRAGRILSGFGVYRYTGDLITKIDIDSTVTPLYKEHIIGKGPQSPNNSGCHVVTWLTPRTFMVDLQTADNIFYATLFITKGGKTRLTNLFSLSEPSEEDESE